MGAFTRECGRSFYLSEAEFVNDHDISPVPKGKNVSSQDLITSQQKIKKSGAIGMTNNDEIELI